MEKEALIGGLGAKICSFDQDLDFSSSVPTTPDLNKRSFCLNTPNSNRCQSRIKRLHVSSVSWISCRLVSIYGVCGLSVPELCVKSVSQSLYPLTFDELAAMVEPAISVITAFIRNMLFGKTLRILTCKSELFLDCKCFTLVKGQWKMRL